MTAPDPATEAAATAIYVNYSDVRSSWTDWTEITDEARDYFRRLATAALDAARPHAEAEATARARQLARRYRALAGLLACYRLGRRPSEKLFRELEATKADADALIAELLGGGT